MRFNFLRRSYKPIQITLLVLTVLGLNTLRAFAQDKVLVPYRVGNVFGLSDVSGKVLLSPRYASLVPIGKNVFTFTAMEASTPGAGSEQERHGRNGVLAGTKEIITNSEHNYFTYLDAGIIVGTANAYTSRNSNFYNLKGEKLLIENVQKFQMIVSPAAKAHKGSIAILAMHADGRVSILLYDGQKQQMQAPLLDHVSNFKMERSPNAERVLICSYIDQEGKPGHDVVYYDDKTGEHLRKPYINEQSAQIPEPELELSNDPGEDFVPMVEGEPMPVEHRTYIDGVTGQTENSQTRFERVNEHAFQYGKEVVELTNGERIFFAEPYTHMSQSEPLIFYKDKKYGLYFSDSKRSTELYDSLIYLRNQYINFDNPNRSMYMAGIKDVNGKWRFGLLNEMGLPLLPVIYESIGFSFDEMDYDKDEDDEPGKFIFKKQMIYAVDANLCLKTYHQGIFVVKKAGKFGLVNKQNIELLPIEYDQIWKNEISLMHKDEALNARLYGYRKGNAYGAFFLERKKGVEKNTGPVFPKIAVSVYEDYMEQKGLDLYILADPSNLNFCYAASNGMLYYKAK